MSPSSTASDSRAQTPGAGVTLPAPATTPGSPSPASAAPRPVSITTARAPEVESRLGVLRHTHFRNVLAAQIFSNIGTWTEMFAIQMYVAHKTGRLDDQGALGVCQQLPIFFLGIFGGLAADRMNRRTLLVVTQLMAGVVAAGVALIATYESHIPERTAIHLLLLLGVLNGCVMAFNFPAWQVLTPRLVPRDELTQAVTVNGIQFNFARVVGPAIAGLVLARWGPPPLLWFNAATFALMALVVMTTPDDPAPAPTGESIKKQVHDAWSFMIHNRGPRAVFLAQIALCLLAAPMVRMISNFVIDVYHLKDAPVVPIAKAFGMKDMSEFVGGTLLATQGVGAVVGGLCIKFVPRWYPKHHFIPLSVAALGLSISCFASCRVIWLGYIAMAVVGWFWMWAFNQSWAMIQVLVPDHLRGRAMSIANVVVFGAMALGAWIAGFGGEQLKFHGVLDAASATQASILMLSVPLFLAGVFMMLYRTPEVDGLPAAAPDTKGARSLYHAITAREHWPDRGGAVPAMQTVEAIQEQEPI